ncbi:MAG: hypothetical protein JNL98_07550 [Bryobacterales bacterium]|nr:hypothetical protein [Bryobacterales bacterium]
MLWYKSWLELRFRVLCTLFILFCLAAFITFSASGFASNESRVQRLVSAIGGGVNHSGISPVETAAIASAMFLVAAVIAPVMSLMLAGGGMNTQTNYGMTPGFHGSMLYTLSLPVTRRQLLWTRAGLGAACYGVSLILCVALIGVAYPLCGVPVSPANLVRFLPGLFAGSAFFYGLAVLLSAVLDEFWGGMAGFLIIGFLAGYSGGDKARIGEVTSLMRGLSILRGQEWPLLAACLWTVAGLALIYAASLWVERREV